MKIRLITAAALAGGLVAGMSGAQAAGSPVLDGKKVTSITTTFSPTAQDHDADLVTGLAPGASQDRDNCAAARCGRLNFVYKPAKGVKGNLRFTLGWTLPGEDFDLYVAEIDKHGFATDLKHCGASAGTTEQVDLDSTSFKPGKTYAVIADYYRATSGDKVTATVAFAPSTLKTTVPGAVDSRQPINCGI